MHQNLKHVSRRTLLEAGAATLALFGAEGPGEAQAKPRRIPVGLGVDRLHRKAILNRRGSRITTSNNIPARYILTE